MSASDVEVVMILNALVERLKRRSKQDFKGRHYEATLILQAVSWYLRYPLSYRDIEELFLERGLEVDHSTFNRWVLAYAPLIERRLRSFRKPHCGPVRIDETYIKIRGQWRYLYPPRRPQRPPASCNHCSATAPRGFGSDATCARVQVHGRRAGGAADRG